MQSPTRRRALIVVDMQNDFADPSGSLFVAGAPLIVPRVVAAIERARATGDLVVYTQDWHPAHTPHFAQDGGIWPVHCVAGTPGAELHPAMPGDGPRIRKGVNGEDGYSGFTVRDVVADETKPTALEPLLRDARVEYVTVCGLATDYCVRATALDAARLGFSTTLLRDAIAAVELRPGDGDRAIDEMTRAGVAIEATAGA
ncbi:MAG TPA: isochorismatase family protein [Candidatus Limnocylindrales bacterium]|nr:isochorismatase family protein [Candidatus Limnocylindrales bacterium]